MSSREVMTSSESDAWNTPDVVLRAVRAVAGIGGRIALDPFWNHTCLTDPVVGVDEARDGFRQSWADVVTRATGRLGAAGYLDAFTNVPYSRMADAAKKIPREAARGVEIVSLIKSATAENWWNDLVWRSASAVCFWYGRLRHAPGPGADPLSEGNTAPFSSAVVYHGPRREAFAAAFEGNGKIVLVP